MKAFSGFVATTCEAARASTATCSDLPISEEYGADEAAPRRRGAPTPVYPGDQTPASYTTWLPRRRHRGGRRRARGARRELRALRGAAHDERGILRATAGRTTAWFKDPAGTCCRAPARRARTPTAACSGRADRPADPSLRRRRAGATRCERGADAVLLPPRASQDASGDEAAAKCVRRLASTRRGRAGLAGPSTRAVRPRQLYATGGARVLVTRAGARARRG